MGLIQKSQNGGMMQQIRMAVFGVAFSLALFSSELALPGIYTDDMARCLVNSTSVAERNGLVKWMFSSAALHPAVKSIASISEAQRQESDKYMAQFFQKLLFERCRTQTQQAVKYEGQLAFESSFTVLGQVAARELFSEPSVAKGMSNLNNYIDKQKMQTLLGVPAPAK
jgi:hypothetical protein